MSEMEIFHGYFEKSDLDITPSDTDNFYDMEDAHGAMFVSVDGELYKFWGSGLDVDPYGFTAVLAPSERPQLLCYWYNGGAGVHEVVEEAIRNYINSE